MAIRKEFWIILQRFEGVVDSIILQRFEACVNYFVQISENFEMNPKKIVIPRSKPRNPLVVPVKQKPTQRHKDRKKEDRNKHKE